MKSVQLEEKLASGGMRAFLFRWPQFNEQNEQWSILADLWSRAPSLPCYTSAAGRLSPAGLSI